jgi:hypothetical protein
MDQEREARPEGWATKSIVLSGVCVAVGVLGFAMSVATGTTDSALLFVGLPTLLALAIAVSRPARSVHGLTFKGITLGLLLAAVLLHEGAICVLFAAPLVYAVGHIIALVVDIARRRGHRGAYAVVPVALLLSVEGIVPGWRVVPVQTVTVTHTVAISPAEVPAHLATGPDLVGTARPWLLATMPLPGHSGGNGIALGDRWIFVFHGDTHGPGGQLVTEVTRSDAGSVEFQRISDTSIVHRWLDWRSARITWHAVDGGTEVRLDLTFGRGLDPSWYFGPVEDVMVGAAADFLLDSLSLADRA